MERRQEKAERRGGSRGRIVVALAAGMAALFVAGVILLFQWRFSSGDVYRAGSILRADPLGGRAFFESLGEMPGLEVERNFEAYRRLEGGPGRVLLMIGMSRAMLDGEQIHAELEALGRFVEAGGRLAIAMAPTRLSAFELEERDREKAEGDEDGEKKKEDEDEDETAPAAERLAKDRSEAEGLPARKRNEESRSEDAEPAEGGIKSRARERSERDNEDEDEATSSLAEEWAFSLEWRTGDKPREGWKARRTGKLEGLSHRDLPAWHSPVFLEELGPGWEVLARVEKKPVLARLVIGDGEVVLATDSYFASNEALVSERATKFLAWFVGERKTIIFDETHLGSERRLNLMQLARRFRLHGFFAGLGLFVILLAWRSSSSLLPGDDELGMGISMRHEVSGQDSATGFRRLLRRSVGKKEILESCFDAWIDQRGRLPRAYDAEQVERVRAVIAREKAAGGKVPTEAYNEIAAILAERD